MAQQPLLARSCWTTIAAEQSILGKGDIKQLNGPNKMKTMAGMKITKRKRLKRAPNLTTISILSASLLFTTTPKISATCNYCDGKSSGYIQVPGTSCSQFVQCTNGVISQTFSCGAGLIYDPSINQCNWATGVTCGPDFECPTDEPTQRPTGEPTVEPTVYYYPPTAMPVGGGSSSSYGARPSGYSGGGYSGGSSSSGGGGSSGSYNGGSSGGTYNAPVSNPSQSTQNGAQIQTETIPNNIELGPNTPFKHEFHAAVFAHLNANKIALLNNIFSKARRIHDISGSKTSTDAFRSYSYLDFYKALRTMVEIGYVVPLKDENDNDVSYRNTFYMGDPTSIDGAAVGLVNVIVFLSQALADSFLYGSCDEINSDSYNGYLATSNSCGQWGLSYQDMHCPLSESHMECPLDYGMQIQASRNPQGVTPFYCGGTDVYPFTGLANYGNVQESLEFPVQNREGRTDVQNCCWWGRGVIHTRGVCQYGKLNYYLGAKAHEEGRPAIFPDIDFCATPQQVCSQDRNSGSVEWITGLFRWIDTVQAYDHPEFNYIQQLNQFVLNGMKDGFFIQSVAGIVTQGCHNPPCEGSMGTAVDMIDSRERWDNFQQVARTLGMPVKSVQL